MHNQLLLHLTATPRCFLTWTNGIASDPQLHVISRHSFGEPHDGCLGSAIHTPVRSTLHARGHGRHIDDVAGHFLVLPETNGCFAGVEHALDVDVKASVPVFVTGVQDGTIEDKTSGQETERIV